MSARPQVGMRLALFACVLASAGCSRAEEAPPPVVPAVNPVDPATAGTLTGTVRFTGTPPAPEPINMRSDGYCAAQHTNPTTQSVLVSAGGGLQNVFVYVKDGLGDLRFPIPSEAVVLDQRGCIYVPRVFGIQVGQTLEILNSDDTLHNIHAMPDANREFNRGQAMQGQRDTHVFSAREVMVPFKCDVHRWMNAWAGVLDHPFYAVSAADGSFTISGLPPGSYTVELWHETLGTAARSITIRPSETVREDFVFGAS